MQCCIETMSISVTNRNSWVCLTGQQKRKQLLKSPTLVIWQIWLKLVGTNMTDWSLHRINLLVQWVTFWHHSLNFHHMLHMDPHPQFAHVIPEEARKEMAPVQGTHETYKLLSTNYFWATPLLLTPCFHDKYLTQQRIWALLPVPLLVCPSIKPFSSTKDCCLSIWSCAVGNEPLLCNNIKASFVYRDWKLSI